MRKLILPAGTALLGMSVPASACDRHLLGGFQRFNTFAVAEPMFL